MLLSNTVKSARLAAERDADSAADTTAA